MSTYMMEEQPSGTVPIVAGLSILGGVIWTALAIAGFAGMLPPIPEQGLGSIPFLGVMAPIGIVFGPLSVAAGLGMWQRQSWGRGLFMGAGYLALIISACRTFSFLNPQSTAGIIAKIIITALFILLLVGVAWVQNHSEEFH
jgi:hypothetical protein